MLYTNFALWPHFGQYLVKVEEPLEVKIVFGHEFDLIKMLKFCERKPNVHLKYSSNQYSTSISLFQVEIMDKIVIRNIDLHFGKI